MCKQVRAHIPGSCVTLRSGRAVCVERGAHAGPARRRSLGEQAVAAGAGSTHSGPEAPARSDYSRKRQKWVRLT